MEQISKIMIIGSKGMAGHVIYYYLKEHTSYSIVDIARGTDFFVPNYQLDITDFVKLEEVIKKELPRIVINCIGILNQNAERHPDKAILLNSYLPHFLAKVGSNLGFKVIHISTDCVFDGKKGGYTEDSIKDGHGFYSQTKALGELNYGNNLTIRTSIIGPELKKDGIGLFHWFMQQSGNIKGYSEAYWTGVTTIELAKGIVAAIEQNVKGLHHLVNNYKINKYDLLVLFKNAFKRDNVLVDKFNDYHVDKSLIKTDQSFVYTIPDYKFMIDEMKLWIETHPSLYNL
ncbi:dTDP-4-dehydrorhamnose reductase family protein [Mucilaginibacter arboris]|uniref:dTDP-4-dehydrorhamnose reductase n=1 Tax=Mucilaginibacter arboris TaxID=2682090 RepID=A0A7K1SVC6_9SPHI|nr:SDR family oxidoreductase [Mucilaginibacter arboris]MVN21000.1 sugar nucleotide-binding protein [Mucilaginibacter arboris]